MTSLLDIDCTINIHCTLFDDNIIIYKLWDDVIKNAYKIKIIDIRCSELTSLPESIGNLTKLQTLKCFCNKLTSLPESIGNLTQLEYMYCSHNKLTSLPESIGNLNQLKELSFNNNELIALPESIGNLIQLKYLDCTHNKLTTLPESIGNLTNLKTFHCDYNQLNILPDSIKNLNKLETLNIGGNKLIMLPESIGNLNKLKWLSCSINQLSFLPKSVWNLQQLKVLSFNNNKFTQIPESIGNLTHLERLFCQYNQLTTLPVELIQCRQLWKFNFDNNPIEIIPEPLQRMINRIRNYENHNGIYVDKQNVHSSVIQDSIKKSIFSLLNDKSTITNEQLHNLIVSIDNTLLLEQTKNALFEYMESTEEHSTLHITFQDLLKKVILRIEKSDGDKKSELYKRLNEEMNDAECKCFTGRLSRLVNVLVGFFDDIKIEISSSEQISVIISLVKQRHNMGDEDAFTQEAKDEIYKELKERNYEEGLIQEWISALD